MVSTGSGVVVGLQIFGTLFLVLLGFLGMSAWIIRRVDRISERLDALTSTLVSDLQSRVSNIEGRMNGNGK